MTGNSKRVTLDAWVNSRAFLECANNTVDLRQVLNLTRIENDFSSDLVFFNNTMRLSRFAQRHNPIDDGADPSLPGRVKRLVNVRRIGAGGADDAQAPHVQTLH